MDLDKIDVVVSIDLQPIFLAFIPDQYWVNFYQNLRRFFYKINKKNKKVFFIEYAGSGKTISEFESLVDIKNKKFITKYWNDVFTSKHFNVLLDKNIFYKKNVLFLGVDQNYCLARSVKSALKEEMNVFASFNLMAGEKKITEENMAIYKKCHIFEFWKNSRLAIF